ncbi:argininosuccinate lyase [Bartonella callosciuri]|uniref:Argininosuccinate lyase n=1 Tax=Bartonella callosciuri TaxID=686223 RepID=A0A840NP99_9HYPH|nr:argininosuccinate lyase [Bartonella callosciuri]
MDELQKICPEINAALFDALTVKKSVKSRTSFGGTVPSKVLYKIAYWKKCLITA